MTTVFDQIRMLPRECPRDSFHESIVSALTSGEVSARQIAPLFEIPGMGFHRALYTLTMFLAEYRRKGRQAFVIPIEMQEALSRTSLTDVHFDDLKLPYSCIYVSMPECQAEVWGGDQTGWHKVGGAFLRYVDSEEHVETVDGEVKEVTEGMINVYLWGMENERSQGPGDDASMWFTFDLGELKGMDLESYLNMMLADPKRDASLEEVTALGRKLGLFTQMPKTGSAGRKALNGIMHAMRVVFNAVLYMDCQEAEVTLDPAVEAAQTERADLKSRLDRMKNPNKSRGRKLRKRLDRLPLDTVSWVGRSVRIKDTSSEPSNGTGTPQRKHWVRGHWWPRRDTIAKRIAAADSANAEAQFQYTEVRDRMSGYTSEDDIVNTLPVLAALKAVAETTATDLGAITDSLKAKRRWVKPYKKGSRGSLPNSHTYVLGETGE
jgi:hypothetical protein